MNTDTQSDLIRSLFRENPVSEFKPFAYYDRGLDCVRVIIRDCSFCEVRISEYFTLLEVNQTEDDQPNFVGFTIKGIGHAFKKSGVPLDGIKTVTEVLKILVEAEPNAVVDFVVTTFGAVIEEDDLKIDFADAA